MEDAYTAEIGHNNPPADDDRSPAQRRVDDIMAAANTWLATVKEITDEETAKACDDFLKQIKDEAVALETERKAFNKPLEDRVRANNEQYRPLMTLLDKAKSLLTPLKTAWLKREQDRIAAEKRAKEEAALKALQDAEDARKQAAASVQDAVRADEAKKAADMEMAALEAANKAKAQVKGNYATRSSGLRTYWSAEITDYAAAVAHYSGNQKVRDVVQQLADADARDQKEKLAVPGVKSKSEERAA